MTPAFRYLLLSANDGKELNNVVSDNENTPYHGKTFDDNLLHQLQNTFGFLELTERTSYTALDLCFAMKDFGGAPT